MSPAFTDAIRNSPFGTLSKRAIWDHYDGRVHDRDHMVAAFERHTENVRREIPAERLLIHHVEQGWEPLCAFLDVPVPSAAFPRVNSRDETKKIISLIMEGDPSDAGGAVEGIFRGPS